MQHSRERRQAMRIMAALVFGALGACTTGAVNVPQSPVIYEVPRTGAVVPYDYSTAVPGVGDDADFTRTIEGALGDAPAATPGAITPLDDDRLNLTLYTIEQQKLDAAAAERELAHARSQLVIVPPRSLPSETEAGVNIALYAQQSRNAVGESIFSRNRGGALRGGCGRYDNADAAQRAFLAAGGPQQDTYNLDPDGDGFACRWDPAPYRQLKL